MIKDLTTYLGTKNFLFSKFDKIEPKQLNSRKKIDIYSSTDIKKHFISIFIINSKSRFLIKNAKEIIELQNRLVLFEGHNFKKNIIIIQSPLCSKAKQYLKENRWIVYDDFM
jgi:hypothetical protein